MGSRGPAPQGRTCDMDGCESAHASRGLCRRHYMKWLRGTLVAANVASGAVVADDGVRSPEDLPIRPKASIVVGGKWAAVLPYPSLDGSQPCNGNEDLFDPGPDRDSLPHDKEALARSLCGKCPFVTACREWGVSHEEYGFFGGMTWRQRSRLRKARGQRLATPQILHMTGFLDRNHDEILDSLAAGISTGEQDDDQEWKDAG